MTLSTGDRLGPYEILSQIGAGGMGDVYKARDTRLERTVAIKVLQAHLSSSPQLRERFDREARAISSLSHPHICALFDVGQQDGVDFLVMEYVEGESLADRLGRGPLPIVEVLRYGAQLAAALAKAHRQGIVHRDLKPGNVMLTKSGAKLLDFGLARTTATGLLSADAPTEQQHPLTAEGTIVGTFQYMAPEQLEGRDSDARTDIFALGAVLYEMVTGRRAFDARTKTSLIASIVAGEPAPITRLQPLAPASLIHVVTRCLAKDPDERWQNASDVGKELTWIAEAKNSDAAATPTVRSRWLPVMLLAAITAVAVAGVAIWRRTPGVARPQPIHLSMSMPQDTFLDSEVAASNIVISPDGARIAFVAFRSGERSRVWIRPLRSSTAVPLPGTDGAESLFWSPDSRFVAFFADGQLKRIAHDGGPSQTICPASMGSGTWGRDDVILFAETEGREGILRVPAAGGAPVVAIKPVPRRPAWQYWPSFLPDGERFLFLETNAQGETTLSVASLTSGKRVTVNGVRSRSIFMNGYLVYVREAALLAQQVDLESGRLRGEPLVIAPSTPYFQTVGWADFSVSSSGTIAYQSGEIVSRLVWFDRQGRELGTIGAPAGYGSIALSPDERKLTFSRSDPKSGNDDIWIHDLNRDVATRSTSEPGNEFNPIWSPDGERLIFAYDVQGNATLNEKRLDEAGRGRSLLPMERFKFPLHASLDGKTLLYSDTGADTGYDLWLLPLEGDRTPRVFQQMPFYEGIGQFSPDGQWIAFASSESGSLEVYVQSRDGKGERARISTDGGSRPQWRRDGKELVYLARSNMLMTVPVSTGQRFEAGRATPLFKIEPLRFKAAANVYDMTDDGQRFLVNSRVPGAPPPIDIVMNWLPEGDGASSADR